MPFKLPYLKRFCYCLKIVTGVRVMTGLALVLGDLYIIMGAAMYDKNDYPFFVFLSAVSYYISGALFCIWFLFLLLLQSLSSKFPRKLALVQAKIVLAWLVFMLVVLIIALQLLTMSKHSRAFKKDKLYLTYGIVCTVFGIVITSYSFLTLKSYISILENEDVKKTLQIGRQVRYLSRMSEALSEHMTELPRLNHMPPLHQQRMMKTLKEEYEKMSPYVPVMFHPTNIRPSNISLVSPSHMSILSSLSVFISESSNDEMSVSSQHGNNKEQTETQAQQVKKSILNESSSS